MSTEIIISSIALLVSLVSLLLTLRINTIQANSAALLQIMDMRKSSLLTEVGFSNSKDQCRKLSDEQIIEIFSYLNLVCKLYLNSAINNNILRTFEGVIIDIFKEEDAYALYAKEYTKFTTPPQRGEPPYINLIYTRKILLEANKIINNNSFFPYWNYWKMLFFMRRCRFRFNVFPNMKSFWTLSEKVANGKKI